jgi:hypothetical protein
MLAEAAAADAADDVQQGDNPRSSSTVAAAHLALTRAITRAQAKNLVLRNVSALTGMPPGQQGRPSRSMTLAQATAVTAAAKAAGPRTHAYVMLSTGRWYPRALLMSRCSDRLSAARLTLCRPPASMTVDWHVAVISFMQPSTLRSVSRSGPRRQASEGGRGQVLGCELGADQSGDQMPGVAKLSGGCLVAVF